MSTIFSKIRIRTPKMPMIHNASWAKELLMTFIGATLSIVLTFGTAHFIDQKQQREDGRQTAMMVIHDMENTAKAMHDFAEDEEKCFNIAQQLLATTTPIDSFNLDTLILFVNYITESAGNDKYTFDDSSERIFLSSQESWKNINNASFIDAVQEFFHNRHIIYSTLNGDRFFESPISNETYYTTVLERMDMSSTQTDWVYKYTKMHLPQPKVQLFINYSFARRRYYSQFEQIFTSAADKCKFMMGISDEELEEYVRNKTRIGKPLTAKKLAGKWKMQSMSEVKVECEYNHDHTFVKRASSFTSYSYYTGQVEFKFLSHGRWELQGDSLIIQLEPEYSYELDRSNIQFRPEMEKAIDDLLATWEKTIQASIEEEEKKGVQRISYFATIDNTSNKIELRSEEETQYLVRIKD